MLNIYARCLNAAVCLSQNFFSGFVGFGLWGSWVRSGAVYITASSDGILGRGRLSVNKYVVF